VAVPAVSTVSSARDVGGVISSALYASVAATATSGVTRDSPWVFVRDAVAAAISAVLLMLCLSSRRRGMCAVWPLASRAGVEMSLELTPKGRSD
jgi:hypothetical protein